MVLSLNLIICTNFCLTQSKMDIIAITETSQKNNENFIINITIDGYATYYTPSNSNKGGTALHVNEKFNFIERKDLSAQNDDYESVWVAIKNKLSKNIVTGCIYRHPRYNFKDFMHYLENYLIKLTKENKEIYLCGDFNIDLLKIEDNQNYQLYNILCSFGFLPKIIQHFSQFLTIKREKMDYKNLSIFQRDYSKFLSQQFRDDVSIQNWKSKKKYYSEYFEMNKMNIKKYGQVFVKL